MVENVRVRKARFDDAKAIADFVNQARPDRQSNAQDVAERFGQVGFLLAEDQNHIGGMIGWVVENLIIRVTDFLIGSGTDRVATGRALINAMEEQGAYLQAEAAMLFLPQNPSQVLIDYWEQFGYARETLAGLPKAWRQAAAEWNAGATEAMIKKLREDLVRKPI
jgi:N-acetylglutamate synthase-like GNAT family acetyltransferase